MVIKEAFIILYACIAVVFVLRALSLPSGLMYVLRTCFIGFGLAMFMLRMLISRCARHWIPERVSKAWDAFHVNYIEPCMKVLNPAAFDADMSSMIEGTAMFSEDDELGPAYALSVPADDEMGEMLLVMQDPERSKIFYALAQKSLTTENIDFMVAVMEWQKQAEEHMVMATAAASELMRESAASLFAKFMKENCDNEVNVSSSCRYATSNFLRDWPVKEPVLSKELAHTALRHDKAKRCDMFAPATREIQIMTYQNLWNKFRAAEAAHFALQDGTEDNRRSSVYVEA